MTNKRYQKRFDSPSGCEESIKSYILIITIFSFSLSKAQDGNCVNFPVQLAEESVLYNYDGKEIMRSKLGRFAWNYGSGYFVLNNQGKFGIVDSVGKVIKQIICKDITECLYNKNRFIVLQNEYCLLLDCQERKEIIDESDQYNKIYELDTTCYLGVLGDQVFFINTANHIKDKIDFNFDYPGFNLYKFKYSNFFLIWDSRANSILLSKYGKSIYLKGHQVTDMNISESLYLSQDGDSCYIFDKQGSFLQSFRCQRSSFISNSVILLKKNKSNYLINLKTGNISNPFKIVYYINDSLFHCIKFNNKHGVVDWNFKVIKPFKYNDINYSGGDSLVFVLERKANIIIVNTNSKQLYSGKGGDYVDNDSYIVIETNHHKFSLFSIRDGSLLLSDFDTLFLPSHCDIVEFRIGDKTGYMRIHDMKFYYDTF